MNCIDIPFSLENSVYSPQKTNMVAPINEEKNDWKIHLYQTQNQQLKVQIKQLKKKLENCENCIQQFKEKDQILLHAQEELRLLQQERQLSSTEIDELFKEAKNLFFSEQKLKQKIQSQFAFLQQQYEQLKMQYDLLLRDYEIILQTNHQKEYQIQELQKELNIAIQQTSNKSLFDEFDKLKLKLEESNQQQEELSKQIQQLSKKHMNEINQIEQQYEQQIYTLSNAQVIDNLNQKESDQFNKLQQVLKQKNEIITELKQQIKENNEDKIKFMFTINEELQEIFKNQKNLQFYPKTTKKEFDVFSNKISINPSVVTYNLSSNEKTLFSMKQKVDTNKSLSTFQFTSDRKQFQSISFRLKDTELQNDRQDISEDQRQVIQPFLFKADSFSSLESNHSKRNQQTKQFDKSQEILPQIFSPVEVMNKSTSYKEIFQQCKSI